jgi:hypothetical protein
MLLTSKNTIGVCISLLLVILLTQAKTFNFLLNTALGRFCLILFILVAAYINNILGIVLVLFIIIIVNQSNSHYLYDDYIEGFSSDASNNESFTGSSGGTVDVSNGDVTCTDMSSCNQIIQKLSSENTNLRNQIKQNNTKTTPSTEPSDSSETTTESFTSSIEGFHILDREDSILKGKKSNEIPIFSNARSQTNYVSPINNDIFYNNYGKV